jgi:hypothetical protein
MFRHTFPDSPKRRERCATFRIFYRQPTDFVGRLLKRLFPPRTAEEYRELLAAAGLRLTRIIPTASPYSIIEAVKAH